MFHQSSRFDQYRSPAASVEEEIPGDNEGGGGQGEETLRRGAEARMARERDEARRESDGLKTRLSTLEQTIQREAQEREASQRRIRAVVLGTSEGEPEAVDEPPDLLEDPKGFADWNRRQARKEAEAAVAARLSPTEIDQRIDQKLTAKDAVANVEEWRTLNAQADLDFRKARPWADPNSPKYDPEKRAELEHIVGRLSGTGKHGSVTQEDLRLAERAIFGPDLASAAASGEQRRIARAMQAGGDGAASRGGSKGTSWEDLSVVEAGIAVAEATDGLSLSQQMAWYRKNVPESVRDRLSGTLRERSM